MKEKKSFQMPSKPQSLSGLELPANVIPLERKENDFQMRVHNILMRVRYALKRPLKPYPDDSKNDTEQ